MGMLKDLFGTKKSNSPDVLGRYPEYMQVRALPERRYLKTSRLLATFILINLGITLALGGIYAYLAERVDVSITSRKAVNLLYIDTEKKQLFPVEHHQKTVSAIQLVAEDFIEKYIKERHTITDDDNEMRKVIEGSGFVRLLSESKTVWDKFIRSAKREIALSTDYRNTYDVLIVTNSCDIAPKSSNNKLITTKADKKLHGIGLKSVAKTLTKYNGDYDWEYDSENKVFTATVMVSEPVKK